jgi:hypothetical protein
MRVPIPALLSMLVLSGCALPPIITIASLAANGVSYATTGKGTADHAISAVAGEDCALLRAARDKAICDPDGDVLIALDGATTADDDWNLDPETGSPNASERSAGGLEASTPKQVPQLTAVPKAPAETGRGKSEASLESQVALALEPSPRGLFADARPIAKPLPPHVQDRSTGWFRKLTARTRGAFKNPAAETDGTAP